MIRISNDQELNQTTQIAWNIERIINIRRQSDLGIPKKSWIRDKIPAMESSTTI